VDKRLDFNPIYSICICNYNMGDSLFKSLTSILEQIDNTFEVILIDDGSNDNSVEICKDLGKIYKNFRFVALSRDNSRQLGETRNYSIFLAKGQWCIFHLDTDDFIGPYIQDFVILVEALSKKLNRDVLFAGQQIHMAKRDFLLSKGPFLNIYRGEDRDLYFRLVKSSEWIIITHKRFIHRIQRSKYKLIVKSVRDLFDQGITDLRAQNSPRAYLLESLNLVKKLGVKVVLFRCFTIYWTWKIAKKRGFLNREDYPSHSEFVAYRSQHTKTSKEWLNKYGLTEINEVNPQYFY